MIELHITIKDDGEVIHVNKTGTFTPYLTDMEQKIYRKIADGCTRILALFGEVTETEVTRNTKPEAPDDPNP